MNVYKQTYLCAQGLYNLIRNTKLSKKNHGIGQDINSNLGNRRRVQILIEICQLCVILGKFGSSQSSLKTISSGTVDELHR